MEAVILAAGEGSRMGGLTETLPKLFLEINEEKLYRHQLRQLAPHCDRITFVLGHGFEDTSDPGTEFCTADILQGTEIRYKTVNEWKVKENAYSALFGLEDINEHTLLVCGDVIFREELISKMLSKFENKLAPNNHSAVGVVRGIQDQMTGIRWNDEGIITNYGAIQGHQEVGLFVLHSNHLSEAREILERNPSDWFPIIFENVLSKPIIVDERNRHEINTPAHLREAREKWHN